MSNLNHPLSPLTPSIDVPHYDDTDIRTLKWETARVEATVKRLKLHKNVLGELRKQSGGELTFEGFNDRFPNFPAVLFGTALAGMEPLHRHSGAIHPMWFKSFRNLPFISFYEDALHVAGSEGLSDTDGFRPFGLVFPRKGFRDGLILHNGDWEAFTADNSSFHLFKGKDFTLLVQPYAAFLDHVRDGISWTPMVS